MGFAAIHQLRYPALRYPMQRFRARKVVEPPKGDFPMEPMTMMETSLCDKEGMGLGYGKSQN